MKQKQRRQPEVRPIRSRAYQLTLLGGRRPVLFIGRRRGGAMLACIAWDELLEIHDLVNRAVAEGAELPEGQIVQLGVSYSPDGAPPVSEALREGKPVARH